MGWKHIGLFCAGGWLYCLIELFWRKHTHWTMFILGGICFVLIGFINEYLPRETSVLAQMVIAAVLVTAAEFIAGTVINRLLGWHVWDYSRMPYNLQGQVCLLYANLWFLLSFPAILLDDWLRWKWFGEPSPHYQIL